MKGEITMTKKHDYIIKMPTEQATPEEIEERKSKLYNLLARWAFEAYCKDNDMEDVLRGVELMNQNNNKGFDKS